MTQTLPYISYEMYLADGTLQQFYGVLLREDSHYYYVTSIIGSICVKGMTTYKVDDLPYYTLDKHSCQLTRLPHNPLMLPFPLWKLASDSYSAEQWHHIGLFLEWFLYTKEKPFQARIDTCQEMSLLPRSLQNKLISFLAIHFESSEGVR